MNIGYDATSAFCEPETGNGFYSRMFLESLINNKHIKKIRVVFPEKEPVKKVAYSQKIIYAPLKNYSVGDRHNACYDSFRLKKQINNEYSVSGIDLFIGPDFTLPYITCPYVVTFHDFGFFHYPEMYNKSTVKHLSYICPIEASTAFGITFVSNTIKEEFENRYPISLANKYIIPNIPKKLVLNPDKLTHKLPERYLLTVGDIMPKKNQIVIIKALILLKRKYNINNLKLVIIGRPVIRLNELLDIIKKNNLQDDISIYSDVSDEEIACFYDKASIYISSSLDEGFGLTPFEAFSFNKPVIASDIPASRETLYDSALFFRKDNETDLALKIFQVIRSKVLRKQMLGNAQKRINYYSKNRFDESVDKMLIDISNKFYAKKN